ncbi:hypothetical protein D779_2776 [Imhoffiella purpurea]|uniref:Uncharacterized protein n=1 Tax=Imhoffiella purpurea TaxID=1249627 RepID=W9VBF9_9GAMM|nr:hypothetical protein D779_2776 [Imhoffiella purpurea]
MTLARYACYVLILASAASTPVAADWSWRLMDGTRLEVDPRTHRAWHLGEAGRRPLWDGAHRLEDGTQVIVRDGMVVPWGGMVDSWSRPESLDARSQPESPDCAHLVERMCGTKGRCEGAESCRLARQIESMANAAETEASASEISGQCREAMANDFFEPCD